MVAAEIKRPTKRQAADLVKKKNGILLDISLGGTPQPNALVLGPTGEFKADPRYTGFGDALPDRSVHTCIVTHILEYLDPRDLFPWFNELHRVMKPYGVAYFSGPYGGDESFGWLSDPCHRTRVTEATWAWLDDRSPAYDLHRNVGRTPPKPWHPQMISRVPGQQGAIGYNVILQAQPVK